MAKSFKGWLKGNILKAKNKELEIIYSEVLDKFNEYYKQDRLIRFILPEGHKGTGNPNIFMRYDCDVSAETTIAYRDEDGEIEEITVRKEIIPKENINQMIDLIKTLPINEPYRCYAIAKKLGWEWKNLWGERNNKTSKAYWLEYYFPIKFLQYIGLIKYSPKGTITRIK